jgi:hypothetical protein
MDFTWITFLIGGVVVGTVLSFIFGFNVGKGTSGFTKTIFGMQTTDLITDLILFGLGVFVVLLSVISGYVRDLTYPRKSPLNFTIETLSMAGLGSVIIFLMTHLRGYPITTKTYEEFALLFLKFGVLHVLLQFSGFYSFLFPPK